MPAALDPSAQLVMELLGDELELLRWERLPEGGWRGLARIRQDSEPGDTLELLAMYEQLAAEACGEPVWLVGPLLDPQLPGEVVHAVWQRVDSPEDLAWLGQTAPQTLRILTRHPAMSLSDKRNRLPRLRKDLPGWTIEVSPLGSAEEPERYAKLPAARALLEGAAPGLGPALHELRADSRRKGLTLFVDAPDRSPMELRAAARALRFQTDLEVQVIQRITRRRAEEETLAAFQALDGVEGARVRWLDRTRGPEAVVEAEQGLAPALAALAKSLKARLGVPVSYCFDSGRSLMQGRIAGAFPPEGILTGIRHVHDMIYEVQCSLPLQPYEQLQAWTAVMEERYGLEILLEAPFLHAPDLRYRDQLGADEETIALRYNRPLAFSEEALALAEQAARELDLDADAASGRRTDRRALEVMSIDPVRTQDLDDALSIRPHPSGEGYELGVHIADVAPFVPQGSALDQEALLRSFTTYLAQGEIPVIPKVLANQVCSLHGGQDSPALSLLMQLDEEARVQEVRLERSVIHNHCRFSYGQAQAILNGGEHRYAEEVRTLGRLAKILRARRKEEEGSLDLSLEADPEKESHQLIEEFMLLANEQVARFLEEHHPEGLCLYRTHPEVNEQDWGPLDQVGQFLKCPVRIKDQPSVQQALEAMLDHPHFDVLRFHVGRALKKASYHFEALGHGALAKQHYAHFTSPIRRYSDLILHRLLEDVLYREERSGSSCYDRETLGMICEHINQMEIRVDSGSFESHRLRDLQRFDGSGRVEEGKVLGLMKGRVSVRLQRTDLSVTARYFTERPVPEEMPLRVTDRDSGMSFQLGQTVRVRLEGVDWGRKSIQARLLG